MQPQPSTYSKACTSHARRLHSSESLVTPPCFAALVIYLVVSLLLDGAAPLTVRLLGLPLAPAMRTPFLSASLADFWGSRCVWGFDGAKVVRGLKAEAARASLGVTRNLDTQLQMCAWLAAPKAMLGAPSFRHLAFAWGRSRPQVQSASQPSVALNHL